MHENRRFRDSIKIDAYPGRRDGRPRLCLPRPRPRPLCPNWELFNYENGFRQIVIADIACNWLQCAENNIDPVHFEWLHNNWSLEQFGHFGERSPRHVRIGIDYWEFGFGYRRILENTDESEPLWTQPRLHIMPNLFMPGGTHFEYRVPVDDEHTLSLVWCYEAVPSEQRPYDPGAHPALVRRHHRPGHRDAGSRLTSSTRTRSPGSGREHSLTATRSTSGSATSGCGISAAAAQPTCRPSPRAATRWGSCATPRRTPSSAGPTTVGRSWNEDFRRPTGSSDGERRRPRPVPPDEYFQFYAGQPPEVRKAYEEAMGI